ncbi:hypothetical protein TRFO_09229 [Tritrichomonas foetus]|uniref:Calponin-homology (CH) domain-containing protein n=1 Tax=Tritrichomonas foetus TaxID=1144522 RepID=A0A1J4JF87_9EUKA|nr:hypothetical protein TRFO_09229 [Tritrichomonas foetus]|eukprot:OHS97810.1 hypothetical protein TRFO_09229 [Tritrichomonas foetus]
MVEWEQTDALLHWMAKFELDTDDFVQDQNKLLDGRVFTQIYNVLASDSIDLSKLKPVANDNAWVNMLLNLRLVGSHLSAFLKENGIEMAVDLSTIARKKDQSELLKLLKYFLIFAMKAPNRKIAIANVRALDRSYQIHIQTILEEFTAKKPQTVHTPQKSAIESIHQRQKIQQLNSEIEDLRAKSDLLTKQVAEKKADIEQLNVNVQSKMDSTLNEMKFQYNEEKRRRDATLEKIKRVEDSISNNKKEIAKMKAEESKITNEMQKGNVTELSIQQLEAKLLIMKQKAMNLADKTPDNLNSFNDFIKMFNVDEKREKVEQLRDIVENYEKNQMMKKAEYDALNSTLNAQNQKASIAMLRRIAQLNEEMDKSPLGEAKRKVFRLRKIIEKLGGEIDKFEKKGGDMELQVLQSELTKMAQRKAYESDLLAKKLSFMQSTAEQCDLRLQRLKLHVGLQLHSNRLKRFKNCFAADADKS